MLHYRLFVEVNDPPREVEKKAAEQLHSWLRGKRLDADALRVGEKANLSPRSTGTLTVAEPGDGARSMRAVISEDTGAHGQWTTQLTVHVPARARDKPWLWLDLDGPDHIAGKIPQLARSLLDVFDASTHDVRQGLAAAITAVEDVGPLVEAVCDPNRRTLVFVAGSDPRLPFAQWLEHVRNLLRESVGLAGGYVLSPEATAAFNNAIGPAHQITPWTVRTFQASVMPDDAEDSRRHRVLGMDRIVADPVRRLANMLGRRAREASLENPLPSTALSVDRAFARMTNAALVATLDATSAPTAGPATAPPVASVPVEIGAPVLSDLLQALELVLGRDITPDRIVELGELAEHARQVQANRGAISGRLDAYEEEVAVLRDERDLLRRQVDEVQLDAAVLDEERAAANDEVARLRKLLSVTDQAAEVWHDSSAMAGSTGVRPQDCDELAERLDEWQRVVYTGDLERLQELGSYNRVDGWAGKIWEVLGVLDDYARAVIEEGFDGNVTSYLGNTPAGFRSYSANRHAADESGDVRSDPKLRALRTFRVPTEVAPEGEIFMGAHFKIAQFAGISPRLHYHNGVRATGRLYVGYIGRHLRNSQTN